MFPCASIVCWHANAKAKRKVEANAEAFLWDFKANAMHVGYVFRDWEWVIHCITSFYYWNYQTRFYNASAHFYLKLKCTQTVTFIDFQVFVWNAIWIGKGKSDLMRWEKNWRRRFIQSRSKFHKTNPVLLSIFIWDFTRIKTFMGIENSLEAIQVCNLGSKAVWFDNKERTQSCW